VKDYKFIRISSITWKISPIWK